MRELPLVELGPDVLGNDRRHVRDVIEVRLRRGIEREHDLIGALADHARERTSVGLPQRVEVDRLVVRHRVERVGDVRRAERLAVAPLDALADREGEGLEAVRPLRRGGQQRRDRLRPGLEDVDELERLVDEPVGGQVDGRVERVEVAGPGGPAFIIDDELAGGRGRRGRRLRRLRRRAEAGKRQADRRQHRQQNDPLEAPHPHPPSGSTTAGGRPARLIAMCPHHDWSSPVPRSSVPHRRTATSPSAPEAAALIRIVNRYANLGNT